MFKIILTLAITVVVINGAPGRLQSNFRLRNSPLRFARQEILPSNADDSIEINANGYKPSGWKPEGRELSLPTDETVNNPDIRYGPPSVNINESPDNRYGAPLGDQPDIDNRDESINQDSEIITDDEQPENVEQPSSNYFVQLPNGQIQLIKKKSSLKIKPAKLVSANVVTPQYTVVPQLALLQQPTGFSYVAGQYRAW